MDKRSAQVAFVGRKKVRHKSWPVATFVSLDHAGIFNGGGLPFFATGISDLLVRLFGYRGLDAEEYDTGWEIYRQSLTRAEAWDLLGQGGEVEAGIMESRILRFTREHGLEHLVGEPGNWYKTPVHHLWHTKFLYAHASAGTHEAFIREEEE